MFSFVLLFQAIAHGAQISVAGSCVATAAGTVTTGTSEPPFSTSGAGGGRLRRGALRNKAIRKLKIRAVLPAIRVQATASVVRGLETIFRGFSKEQRVNDWVFGKAKNVLPPMNARVRATVKKRDLALQLVTGNFEVEDFR